MGPARLAGQALGRLGANEGLREAWEIGRPRLADLVVNALPSLLYGGSLFSQKADPLTATAAGVWDLGAQTLFDASLGPAGAALARRTAGKGIGRDELRSRMEGWSNWGKMAGGMGLSMVTPNWPAQRFYREQEQKAAAQQEQWGRQLYEQGLADAGGPAATMTAEQELEDRITRLAAQHGVDARDPLARMQLAMLL